MQFQITIDHNDQQINYNIRQAVYFQSIVYQVISDQGTIILYKQNDVWRSNTESTSDDLINKIGTAIEQTAN